MRKSVVLPDPFGPTSPTFSPGLSWNDASTKSTCLPYCLLTLVNEIMKRACYAGRRSHRSDHRQDHLESLGGAHRVWHVAGQDHHLAGRDNERLAGNRHLRAAVEDLQQRVV